MTGHEQIRPTLQLPETDWVALGALFQQPLPPKLPTYVFGNAVHALFQTGEGADAVPQIMSVDLQPSSLTETRQINMFGFYPSCTGVFAVHGYELLSQKERYQIALGITDETILTTNPARVDDILDIHNILEGIRTAQVVEDLEKSYNRAPYGRQALPDLLADAAAGFWNSIYGSWLEHVSIGIKAFNRFSTPSQLNNH